MSAAGRISRRERQALQTLGLARRAGRVVIGTEAVLAAVRARKLAAVVVAGDASANARRRVANRITAGVSIVECGTREALGNAVGRDGVAVVGVTDRRFSSRIIARLEGGDEDGGEVGPAVDAGSA